MPIAKNHFLTPLCFCFCFIMTRNTIFFLKFPFFAVFYRFHRIFHLFLFMIHQWISFSVVFYHFLRGRITFWKKNDVIAFLLLRKYIFFISEIFLENLFFIFLNYFLKSVIFKYTWVIICVITHVWGEKQMAAKKKAKKSAKASKGKKKKK